MRKFFRLCIMAVGAFRFSIQSSFATTYSVLTSVDGIVNCASGASRNFRRTESGKFDIDLDNLSMDFKMSRMTHTTGFRRFFRRVPAS